MPVDKEVLIQYCEMKEEIKDIRRRKEKLEKEIQRLEKLQVSDIVKGSKGEWDIYGPIKITGIPIPGYEDKKKTLKKLVDLLAHREAELVELTCQVEEYIQSIPKSEVQTMFRLYYIDGMPWWKVAQAMNRMFPKRRVRFTEDSCWQRDKRFFEKN